MPLSRKSDRCNKTSGKARANHDLPSVTRGGRINGTRTTKDLTGLRALAHVDHGAFASKANMEINKVWRSHKTHHNASNMLNKEEPGKVRKYNKDGQKRTLGESWRKSSSPDHPGGGPGPNI